MPKIVIKENENEVMRLLNPTDNVVLIPLVCKLGTEDTKLITSIYTPDQITLFNSEFRDIVVKQAEAETEAPVTEKSFIYATMLLKYGISVVIKPIVAIEDKVFTEAEVTRIVNNAISSGIFAEFEDKNIYNIKFITTGAHANILAIDSSEGTSLGGCHFELAKIASKRCDCISLIELENDIICETNMSSSKDIKNILAGEAESSEYYKYAACVFPWGYYNVSTVSDAYVDVKMPGSFGYLSAFANSVQTNANWYAVAGVNRGAIPNLSRLSCEIGESQMHILLNEADGTIKFNVNPIMKVSEYGSKIWGNKVASVNTTTESYQSYLNVRVLLCDIKKQIYYAATRVTFEPNDLITWLNFKELVNELLEDMRSNRGVDWYSWKRENTDKKATIKAILTVKPIEAVENFEITVNLSSEEAEVTEI